MRFDGVRQLGMLRLAELGYVKFCYGTAVTESYGLVSSVLSS